MAETSSDWADRPASDVSRSSDDEDSEETVAKQQLPSSFKRSNLEANSSESITRTRTSTPGTTASMLSTANAITSNQTKKPMQLLELPLDVLKDIIKEVGSVFLY